jgi:hypothetical protein
MSTASQASRGAVQFSPAKQLPGGEEGVEQLEAHLDCGLALVLANLDLGSLRDPEVLPVPLEKLQAQRKRKQRVRPRRPHVIACSVLMRLGGLPAAGHMAFVLKLCCRFRVGDHACSKAVDAGGAWCRWWDLRSHSSMQGHCCAIDSSSSERLVRTCAAEGAAGLVLRQRQ